MSLLFGGIVNHFGTIVAKLRQESLLNLTGHMAEKIAWRCININREKVHLSRKDEEVIVVGAEREIEREREKFVC